MYYKIQVNVNDKLSLLQAINLINMPDLIEQLSEEQKKWVIPISGNRHELILEGDRSYFLEADTLEIRNPVYIHGNDAVLSGTAERAMIIMSSDVTAENLVIDGFPTAITINPYGMEIQNISVRSCRFSNYTAACIQTGSSISDGKLRHLSIEGCFFEGSPQMIVDGIEDWYSAPVCIMLMAGCTHGEATIKNCLIEDVWIQDCTFRGRRRNAVNTIPAVCGIGERNEKAINCVLRDLRIDRCSFQGAYDATINIMGSYANNINSLTENITITNCDLIYNIWGIYFCATEPCEGTVDGAVVRNIEVSNNTLTLREGGSGEDSAALAIQCGRLDYADGAKANHGVVENVVFRKNVIYHTQHGIFLNAADSMVDGLDTQMIGNEICHVLIEENQLYEVDDCFTFYGAQLEGRRVDVRLGIPPRTMRWLPALTDHRAITCVARDNVIWDVVCRNNFATGHKYMYKIAGAKAAGHAYVEGNRVAEDIIMENNIYENGEDHILVEDAVLCDWTQSKDCTVPKRYR